MNYSTLLNRSVDWEGAVRRRSPTPPTPTRSTSQLFFGLIQMLWDRAEANGYAHHMTDDPLPNTPAHQVMLQVAYADHQVVEHGGRGRGPYHRRPLSAGPRVGIAALVDGPGFGLGRRSTAGARSSFLVYWSCRQEPTAAPQRQPPVNRGRGPPRGSVAGQPASDQAAHFLLTGALIDVCDGGPCVTTDASRKN